jgi:hypothetical protein
MSSCVDLAKEIEDKLSSPQVTEVQKNEGSRPPPSEGEYKNYKPREVLVKFRDGTDQETIEAIQEQLHLKTIRLLSKPHLYLMKILDGSSVESVVESLGNYKEVQYSEPNYVRSTR